MRRIIREVGRAGIRLRSIPEEHRNLDVEPLSRMGEGQG